MKYHWNLTCANWLYSTTPISYNVTSDWATLWFSNEWQSDSRYQNLTFSNVQYSKDVNKMGKSKTKAKGKKK